MAIRQLLIHKHEVYLLDYMLEVYKRLGGNPFKVFGWVIDDAKRPEVTSGVEVIDFATRAIFPFLILKLADK